MADEEEDVAAEEQVADGGKRKKLIIIGAAVVLLLAAIGSGAFWFLSGDDEAEVVGEDGEVVEADAEGGLFASGPGKAIYHKLKPNFVTTFEANSRQRYVQLEVTLVTREAEVIKALVKHQPLIRNALVMLIAEQDYLELQTKEGKAVLRDAAVTTVQGILETEIGIPGIEQVLFTEFVMQ